MQTVTTIGLDIAKSVFQVHGIDAAGNVIIRRRLKRRHVLAFFQRLPPCVVGIEACATSHHWSRELKALGHAVRLMPPAYTIVNAIPPAPVALRHIIGQMLPDVVFGSLRQAIPDRVPAEGTSCLYLMTFRTRDAEATRRFAISVATNGGTGARPSKDGLSATAYPSGVKGTPVEIVETTTPLLF